MSYKSRVVCVTMDHGIWRERVRYDFPALFYGRRQVRPACSPACVCARAYVQNIERCRYTGETKMSIEDARVARARNGSGVAGSLLLNLMSPAAIAAVNSGLEECWQQRMSQPGKVKEFVCQG